MSTIEETINLTARAKINLTLYVIGRRPDGYHDLELIFQPVSLADELWIREVGGDDLAFSCSVATFENENNLVCRGYRRMRERFPGQIPGLSIHLEKKIPSGAGMGGGSTDCSALLVWLNQRYGLGLSREELIKIGAGLGADVPACMIPHATIGRGIGEELSDIRTDLSMPLLLIKPEMSFSTAEMYTKVDAIPYDPAKNRNREMVAALEEGNIPKMAGLLYNVFEEAVPEREKIEYYKRKLTQAGALGSLMTGSGSVVFGVFADAAARDLAAERLRGEPGVSLYCCETVNERGLPVLA